ncbi:heavy metal translocating P-type ATPase [Paenibacillus sacheonensis]|uniref:P-type Cu(+) transporter n=1 Tax=Paenibacillus sacheonensis TaxID=742054 RepID=A0A7X5BWA8_9BACL|nr:cation-translocating P-type ATPase [Paenibacillus sacheonensis]MBM7564702.1 Cu+-exporting ATPase [Paenibacillus sacheonensis]NBC69258.1 heavy metal translocating P-type ATPase [Paenibacillus sacheonensis]
MQPQGEEEVLDLRIHGMSCTACATRIERAVGKLSGVSTVSVHYAAKSAYITYDAGAATPAGIIERISQIGFQAFPHGRDGSGGSEIDALKLRVFVGMLLTLPLLWTMAHHYSVLSFIPVPAFIEDPILQLLLASIVQFFIGMPFYFGAYYALRERTANMDVLVAIGTSAAYVYSYAAMLTGGALYFETSAVVITAVLVGKLLEAAASERVMKEGDGYASLQAKEAIVVRGGKTERIPLDRLRIGDQLIVESNEHLPADGLIVEGESTLDESFLTGESGLVKRTAGEHVYAGTTVRGQPLRLQVLATGRDTMLSRIAAMTRQAQATKSSIGRRVDRMSAVFVPVMMLLSFSTLLLWLLWLDPGNWKTASIHALAVLLAACPCALGLAAPISLVLATGKLARRGIVLKEAGALERLASLDLIVLDKTGTLTEGKPAVTGISALNGAPNALLRLAAAAEERSQHPFAAAMRESARRAGLVVPASTAYDSYPGKGIEALVEGKSIAIGNAGFAAERAWVIHRSLQGFAGRKEEAGETVIYAFIDGLCAGAFSLSDSVKRTSKEAVEGLLAEGVSVLLATGDHPSAASKAAAMTGIKNVHASLLPEQKAALIRKLQNEGLAVAMAGDGWNDAPALAAADVGIAMGGGTEAALDAGDMTLLRSRLTGISEALLISRLTVRNIRQNLAFAFLYNAVVIPFAAIGGIEPWMAGTAMALSSVSVVGNALRLNGQMRRQLDRPLST